jgi:hypothetical protein
LVGWAVKELNFRKPKTRPLRTLESSVVVVFDRAIGTSLAVYDELRKSLARAVEVAHGLELEFDLNAISLAVDPFSMVQPLSALLKTEFTIVRRINRPYSDNRYFCTAGLSTTLHLQMLEQFEALVLSKVGAKH